MYVRVCASLCMHERVVYMCGHVYVYPLYVCMYVHTLECVYTCVPLLPSRMAVRQPVAGNLHALCFRSICKTSDGK
jgi:hypothetical protein